MLRDMTKCKEKTGDGKAKCSHGKTLIRKRIARLDEQQKNTD